MFYRLWCRKSRKDQFSKIYGPAYEEKGAEVYVFDGCLRELEEFSRNNDLDGYMTDKEELYHFMENELLPQLGERNELVYEARQAKTSVKEALKNYKRMVPSDQQRIGIYGSSLQ